MKITDYAPSAETAFAKLAGFQQVADMLNLFLSCECEARLNDAEVDDATGWFETLCELRPECIKLAQGAAYVVTVKLEKDFSRLASDKSPHWVARDETGSWRCYCQNHFGENAQEAIAAMFHANEVLAVRGNQAVISDE